MVVKFILLLLSLFRRDIIFDAKFTTLPWLFKKWSKFRFFVPLDRLAPMSRQSSWYFGSHRWSIVSTWGCVAGGPGSAQAPVEECAWPYSSVPISRTSGNFQGRFPCGHAPSWPDTTFALLVMSASRRGTCKWQCPACGVEISGVIQGFQFPACPFCNQEIPACGEYSWRKAWWIQQIPMQYKVWLWEPGEGVHSHAFCTDTRCRSNLGTPATPLQL